MKKATADWLQSAEMDMKNLSSSNDNVPPFSWHSQILKDREKLISEGKATFSDFNETKAKIRDKIQLR